MASFVPAGNADEYQRLGSSIVRRGRSRREQGNSPEQVRVLESKLVLEAWRADYLAVS
jgi:hypothetical protein